MDRVIQPCSLGVFSHFIEGSSTLAEHPARRVVILGQFVKQLKCLLALILTQALVSMSHLREEAHYAADNHAGAAFAHLVFSAALLEGVPDDTRAGSLPLVPSLPVVLFRLRIPPAGHKTRAASDFAAREVFALFPEGRTGRGAGTVFLSSPFSVYISQLVWSAVYRTSQLVIIRG